MMIENLVSIQEIKSYRNVPELIAESLKEAILQGKIKGGAQLKQDEIARQFDVSLIPVREALIQLEGKGLVKCIRNKGTVVTHLSVAEMKELFEVRKILEAGIIQSLPDTIDAEKLEKMKFLLCKMENEENIFKLARHNRLFHELLCDAANNKQINSIYQNLFVRVERYLMYLYYFMPERTYGFDEHKIMVKLLEEKDVEALLVYSKSHIERTQNEFLEYLSLSYNIDTLDWNSFIPFNLNYN